MDKALDFAPCGYISFDDNGIAVTLNQTLANLLEVSKGEVIGVSIENFLTVASRIFYNTHLFPLLKLHGSADEIFLSLRSKNKKDIPVLLNGRRTKSESSFINEFVFIHIHQRKEYEDKLLSAKRDLERAIKENEHLVEMKSALELRTVELDQKNSMLTSLHDDLSQFSKIMSHDLQETLHKMNVFTDKLSIEEGSKFSDSANRTLQKILTASVRAKALINGLNEFIQISTDLTSVRVDLNSVIQYARAKAERRSGFSDFTISYPFDLPEFYGNEEQLVIAIHHIFLNSIQNRNPNKKLSISIQGLLLKENIFRHLKDKYKYSNHIKITIEDNGFGFDNSLNEYIFGLFKKINTDSSGLGLGLALARKIIHNHGGTIDAGSTPDSGAKFIILLPLKNDLLTDSVIVKSGTSQ